MIDLHTILIGIVLAIFAAWLVADHMVLWQTRLKTHFVWNQVDFYWSIICLLPILLGHFLTIWGNYFRASSQFQHSISKITTPASEKQRASIWERHDSYFGFTFKFWCLTGVIASMNLYWFILSAGMSRAAYIATFGYHLGTIRSIAFGGAQAVLLDTSVILFLVLRRSMLQAIGFTYHEIIPLHRWLGFAIFVWSTIHVCCYSAYMSVTSQFMINMEFSDKSRGTRNLPGVFAWIGVVMMSFFALPRFRRLIYPVFLYVHRAGTFAFFIGLIMHYPTVMLWYYMLPSFVLFLLDRLVPRIIQARSINPVASCTLNRDADIICMKFTSPEPMKPYYPGDYIKVQVPGLGEVFHPFSIASYWPEDPYSITLYIRVITESRFGWTKALAKRCGIEDKPVAIRANVDGVFGDRRHDYLKSETMIVFVAGAAITTFMALIKAIAAQIAASNEPLRMKLYLICTFRTRSELHAYGSFLHQITRDPRFTAWLNVEIYVSRPDKPQTLTGTHAYVVKKDVQMPAEIQRRRLKKLLLHTSTKLRRALSGRTIVELPLPALTSLTVQGDGVERPHSFKSTVETLQDHKEESTKAGPSCQPSSSSAKEGSLAPNPTKSMTYSQHPLPTFEASSAHAVSKRLASLDLLTSAILVAVPLACYYSMRVVHFEGPRQWCPASWSKDSYTVFVCMWTYALIPGLVHVVVMLSLGYAGMFLARKIHMRHYTLAAAANNTNVEAAAVASSDAGSGFDDKQLVEDGNWDDGDVVYSRGRMDVRQLIQLFADAGVGKEENGRGSTAVFAGGPEGFVNMIKRQVQKADWTVEFHCETWTP